MSLEPGAGELIGLIVALAVASLAMVYVMVQWSGHLLAVPVDPAAAGRRRRALPPADAAGRPPLMGERRVAALVAGAFWAVHGLIVWFSRAISRANARAAAAAPPDDVADAEAEEEAEREEAAAAEAQPAAATPTRSWRDRLQGVVMLLLVLGVIMLGEASPLMQALNAALASQEAAWLAGAITLAAVGFVFLMGGAIDMALTRGQPMSRAEVEAMARIHREVAMRPGAWGKAAYRVRGPAVGSQAEGQVSFAEMKAAWRTEAWRRSRRWQRIFVMAAGALCLFLGVFGIPFVLGTAGVKLLVLAVWGFVLIQVARGFRRA